MSRQTSPEHLARRRSVRLNGSEIARTPLLVPSFSSKGFPEIKKILEYASGLVEGAMLVSAYDTHYQIIEPPFDFASLVFLDSGGYEAGKEAELSAFAEYEDTRRGWSEKQYEEETRAWSCSVPTVFISYDHPDERIPVPEQVLRASRLLPKARGRIRELLLKPEKPSHRFIKIASLIENAHLFADFDIIGLTEKDLGASILERMTSIAELRGALSGVGLDVPLHIFGSLDTVTTPLYFIAGADIFDGLTWLRFAYVDGQTVYKQNYGALQLELTTKTHLLDGRCWNNNYYYLKRLELEMRRFLDKHDFRKFEHHGDKFRDAFTNMMEQLGVKHGRRGRNVSE